MRPDRDRWSPPSRCASALSLLSALILVGCAVEAPSPGGVERPALRVESALGLAPIERWRGVSLPSTRLVTPRFSPEGEHLLARGYRGRGLYLFSTLGLQLAQAEVDYEGDAVFSGEGELCRGPRDDARLLRLDPSSPSWRPTDDACELMVEEEGQGERIASGAWGAVYHDAYLGLVTRVSTEGEREVIENEGAFFVAVAPDGRRVAWCLGSLSEPQLLVHDEAGTRALDRGAQPTWSPDGRFLVFTIPELREAETGLTEYRADLSVFDAETGEVAPLTQTPEIAEMQPTFSPDGRWLAFADWAGAEVIVAPLVSTAPEGGQS